MYKNFYAFSKKNVMRLNKDLFLPEIILKEDVYDSSFRRMSIGEEMILPCQGLVSEEIFAISTLPPKDLVEAKENINIFLEFLRLLMGSEENALFMIDWIASSLIP
jgi:hypothetical protein